jgi:hypothetical protein
MSKQKVFSHDIDINYNDYTKNKNGIEILKNIKSKNQKIIKKFINYEQFIILTKAYYNFLPLENVETNLDKNNCKEFITKNLYNANISFFTFNTVLNHFNNCNCCNQQSLNIYNNNCETLKNILYPYGVYISNNISNMYFNSNLKLDNWCLERKKNCNINKINEDFNCNTLCCKPKIKNNCKYGLCKNAKPLFI